MMPLSSAGSRNTPSPVASHVALLRNDPTAQPHGLMTVSFTGSCQWATLH